MEGAKHEEPQFNSNPCKCTPPKAGTQGRQLVVCIDGTSHQFGTKNTNVIEFYKHIIKSKDQLTCYIPGIGTSATPSCRSLGYWGQVVTDKIDLALAINLDKVIIRAYKFLSNNYQDGDMINLIGFSRGAYQARVLAGMIEKIGLILPQNEEQIPYAYELYAGLQKNVNGDQLSTSFKGAFCRESVRVHFVGVWDTISSVGLFRDKLLPLATESCEHICLFRHALALDECRVKFLPECVYGPTSATPDEDNFHMRPHRPARLATGLGSAGIEEEDIREYWEWETPLSRYSYDWNTPQSRPRIKEVWFAGSHADIGGGNKENINLQSGGIPLQWMRNEAIMAGLLLHPADINWKAEDLERKPEKSLTLGWWIMECMPFRRISHGKKDATKRPHMGRGRKIVPGQKIHASVLLKSHYRPKARLWSPEDTWPGCVDPNNPRELEMLTDLDYKWEKDLFDSTTAGFLVDKIRQPECKPLEFIDRLCFMASFREGKSAINAISNAQNAVENLFANEDKAVKISATVTRILIADVPPHCQEKMLHHECISAILDFLQDERVDWQCRALNALPPMGRFDSLRDCIVTDRTLRILLEKCRSTNDQVHSCSARALSLLLHHRGVRQDVMVQSKTDLTATVEYLLRSQYDIAGAACASIINVLVEHGSGLCDILVENIVPWLANALGGDNLINFCRVTQVLTSFSQHGRLGDIISVPHRITPSVVVSAIVKWLGRNVLESFGVATTCLLILAQPCNANPDAIRCAIRSAIWDSGTLQILINKALKSSNQWIVYHAVAALQLFVDHDSSRAAVLQASHVFPAIQKILKEVTVGEIGEDRIRRTLDAFAKHGDSRPVLSKTIRMLVDTLDRDDPTRDVEANRGDDATGDVVYRLSSVMSSLADKDPGLRDILSTSNIVPILVRRLKSDRIDCPRIHNICRGLYVLAKHDQIRDTILDSGAISSLVRRSKNPSSDKDTTGVCALECLDEFKRHGLR